MAKKASVVDKRIVALLHERGVKPAVLAKGVGMSSQMAGAILRGERGIARWRYASIARLLGMDINDLFVLKSHTLAVDSALHTQPGESIAASSPSNPFSAATVQEMSESITRLREISIELTRHADAMSRRLAAIAGHLSPYGADRDRADGPKSRKTSHR